MTVGLDQVFAGHVNWFHIVDLCVKHVAAQALMDNRRDAFMLERLESSVVF